MLWNSAAYFAQHSELARYLTDEMKSFTGFERNAPAANCDATRWKTLA